MEEMSETELSKFLGRTKCPRKFARLDLDSMHEGSSEDYISALKQISRVGQKLRSREFLSDPIHLLISGPFGSGKTRAACWLLRVAYEGLLAARSSGNEKLGEPATVVPVGLAPLFIRVPQLADLRFRSLSGRDDESEDEEQRGLLRERLDTCSLLLIDDVARVAGYRGEEQFVESVVERRWEDNRSVILTGNVDGEVDASGKRQAGLSPRFRDFLNYFEVALLTGETRRGL
jgi:DNA replication protein DnaC